MEMSSVELSLSRFPPPNLGNNFHNSVAPELLQHIIEYTATSSSTAWWQSRSQSLASLCLVSRRFRSIAQPLLYKKISLDTRSRFAKLLRSTPLETLGAVRLLYSGIKWHDELDLENLYTLAKFAPRIQSLTVNKSSWSLGPFAGSNNLTTLSLREICLSVATSYSFPSVKYLSLSSCYIQTGHGGGEGVHFDTPSVRHLAFHPRQPPREQQDDLMVSLSTPVLFSVTTWLSLVEKLPEWITKYQERVCYDAEISQVQVYVSSSSKIRHLRLYSGMKLAGYGGYEFGRIPELLEEWTLSIYDANQLETLRIEAQFHPKAVWQDADDLVYARYSQAFKNLLDLCSRRRIQLTCDTPLFNSEFWDIVSPSFIQMSTDLPTQEGVDGIAL